MGVVLSNELFDVLYAHVEEAFEPSVLAEAPFQQIAGFNGGGVEVEFALQEQDVFNRDLTVGNLDLEIGLHLAAARRFGIEREYLDGVAEILFEAAHGGAACLL